MCVAGEYWIKFLKEDELTKPASPGWLFLYDFFSSFKNAVAVIFIIFALVARPVWVDGKSMLPTLQNNDWLIVTEIKGKPQRGDIIVSCQPNVYNEQLIKRVIAVAGDTIDIDFSTGSVYLNGELYNEPYINEGTFTGFDVDFPLTVNEGCVFVMGDNRNNSLDSRSSSIGLIKEEYILGKARIRFFPPATQIYTNKECQKACMGSLFMEDNKPNENVKPRSNKLLHNFYDIAEIISSAVIAIMIMFTFIFRFVGVIGSSMETTLTQGDWLCVSAYISQPEYGDIVIITHSNFFTEPLVKRVIAVGGQTVDLKNGSVYVDGKKLTETYAHGVTVPLDYVVTFPLEVPEGKYFVLGDNRENSTDSRSALCGLIDEDDILGRVRFRLLPFGDFNVNN